jgi:hypothetical protein
VEAFCLPGTLNSSGKDSGNRVLPGGMEGQTYAFEGLGLSILNNAKLIPCYFGSSGLWFTNSFTNYF